MTGCWSHFCWGASVGVRFVAESEKTGRGMGGVFSKKNIEVKSLQVFDRYCFRDCNGRRWLLCRLQRAAGLFFGIIHCCGEEQKQRGGCGHGSVLLQTG